MTPEQLDFLIDDYLDGRLSADQRDIFEHDLLADPAAMDRLIAAAAVHRLLQDRYAAESHNGLHDLIDALGAETPEPEGPSVMDLVVDQALALRRQHEIEDEANRKLAQQQAEQAREDRYRLRRAEPAHSRRVVVIPTLAVAGVVAAALAILAVVFTPPASPKDDVGSGQVVQTPPRVEPKPEPTVSEPAVFAMVVDQVDTRWEGRRGGARVGDTLDGEVCTLEQGTLELRVKGGATLIVQGPARFEMQDESHVDLTYGRAISTVPLSAPEFTITLPGMTLTNVGSDLGVVAFAGGVDRIDVFAGSVDVVSSSLAGGSLRLEMGRALQMHAGESKQVVAEHKGYVRNLARLHYRDAVLADAPLSYWAMQDDPSAAPVGDMIPAGMALFPRLAPINQTAGPMGGMALDFDGRGLLDLADDGLLTTSRYNRPDAFTFEAWVRPDATTEAGYLVVANMHDSQRSGWGIGVKPIEDRRHVTPFLAVGEQVWDFTNAQLPTGGWVHLAVCKTSDGTARLYIDGREAGRHTGVPGPPSTAQYVHLAGRLTGERWRGGMAHVAYYPRALSPGEIELHASFGTDRQTPDDD